MIPGPSSQRQTLRPATRVGWFMASSPRSAWPFFCSVGAKGRRMNKTFISQVGSRLRAEPVACLPRLATWEANKGRDGLNAFLMKESRPVSLQGMW